MADKTGIEWTRGDDGTPGATWNPVAGCSIVSAGCSNCYAMKQAHGLEQRFGSEKYSGLTKVVNGHPVWTGVVRLVESALDQPLRWKKPRRIFVNSMSDLFHENLSFEDIGRVFQIMEDVRHHTFQVLTKRAERMREFIEWWDNRWHSVPSPNIWLGVSVEDQQRADERIPLLLQTPAAVRFLSCEPLLGPVNLGAVVNDWAINPLVGFDGVDPPIPGLDWIIIGGESGPRARPVHLSWISRIIQRCQEDEVACFVKQLGSVVEDDVDPLAGCIVPRLKLRHSKGGDPEEWPEWARVRQFPIV